jgi:hypothetical protein
MSHKLANGMKTWKVNENITFPPLNGLRMIVLPEVKYFGDKVAEKRTGHTSPLNFYDDVFLQSGGKWK